MTDNLKHAVYINTRDKRETGPFALKLQAVCSENPHCKHAKFPIFKRILNNKL